MRSFINDVVSPTILLGSVAVVEIALGCLALSGRRAAAALATLFLFVVFAASLVWLVFRGHEVSKCGCFGALNAPVLPHFVFVASVAWIAFRVIRASAPDAMVADAPAPASFKR